MFKSGTGAKKSLPIVERINDHAFVSPGNGKDACKYEQCRKPKLAHEWTVEAHAANPGPLQ